MEQMRLDKAIASQTKYSRREIKLLAARGKLLLNGRAVKQTDIKIQMDQDEVVLDGVPLSLTRNSYLMLNKPRGVLCAVSDARLPTVLDYVPEEYLRTGLFPAGRLDKDTEGFVLITNDGELAHRLLAPKSHVQKVYLAKLDKPFGQAEMDAFTKGMELPPEEGRREKCKLLPAELSHADVSGALAKVVLHQGLYHQVKRMFAALGLTVLELQRVQIGGLALDPTLESGECRPLTPEELEILRSDG